MLKLDRFSWMVVGFYGLLLLLLVVLMGYNPNWAHKADLNFCFQTWSEEIARDGMATHTWTNYFPLGRYTFWLFGTIKGSREQIIADIWQFKIIHTFLDVLICLGVFWILKTKMDAKKAFGFSLMVALNVAHWYGSVVWGQMDSLYILLLMAAVYALYLKKGDLFIIMVVLGFNSKPQFWAFMPILCIYYFLAIRPSFRLIVRHSLVGLVVLFIVLLPFIVKDYDSLRVFYNTRRFVADLDRIFLAPLRESHNNLSVSAYNIWTLIYGSKAFEMSSLEPLWGGMSYKNICTFLFFIFEVALIGLLLNKFYKSRSVDLRFVFLTLAAVTVGFYFISPNMHERYLQPIVPFLGIFVALKPNKTRISMYVFSCLAYFMSLVFEMKNYVGPRIPWQEVYFGWSSPVKSICFLILMIWVLLEVIYFKEEKANVAQ